MNTYLDLARTFLEASVLFGAALCLLFWFFALWLLIIDRAVRLIGIHGAMFDFIRDRARRSTWWHRTHAAWYRWFGGAA